MNFSAMGFWSELLHLKLRHFRKKFLHHRACQKFQGSYCWMGHPPHSRIRPPRGCKAGGKQSFYELSLLSFLPRLVLILLSSFKRTGSIYFFLAVVNLSNSPLCVLPPIFRVHFLIVTTNFYLRGRNVNRS